jgi:transposase
MNTTSLTDSTTTPASFAAWIGLDWGDKEHAYCLAVGREAKPESGKLLHSAENLHRWLQGLAQRFGGRPVALGLESNRGALLHVLAQYPWLEIFPVNPATSARYRQAFVPSGAKDDLPDAALLLDLVRFHAHKLRPLLQDDESTRQLAALVQARRDTVDRRTQTLNQLTSVLKSYYPQAWQLVGEDLSTTMALEFLRRWPDLLALKSARPTTLRNFYYRHNVRRPELVKKRLESLQEMVALTTDEAVVSVARMQLKLLLELLTTFNKHIGAFDAQIADAFAAHSDKALFENLPGAGKALAPRLAVAFGSERTRYADAASFQKYVGLAPVREKSGRQLWTHWRWQAPVFTRQSLVEWAGQTVVWCDWARRYYQRMKAKGKKHHVILRALAFKWARILWKCWQTHTPYDHDRYLKALKQRNSPNLPLTDPAAATA